MKIGFEKKFVDKQSELIAICLEIVPEQVDKVYAYAYIGEGSSMFNFFFEQGENVIPAHKLIPDTNLLFRVMGSGTDILEKLQSLCAKYETKCPMEMKMYYDCKTRKFTADYEYGSGDDEDFSPHDSFVQWRDEVAAAKSK